MFFIDLTTKYPQRFNMGKFLPYLNNGHDILQSHLVMRLKSLGMAGKHSVVGSGGHPELVSYDIYGDTQYWWVIMLYNDILDPSDIVNGMVIRYPSKDQLEELYFSLRSLQSAEGEFYE